MVANNGKSTILFMTDLAGTGFGRVGEEIVKRFAQTGKYNIVYFGWAAKNSPQLHFKWKELGVKVVTTTLGYDDQFGQTSLPETLKQYQPDIVWTLGDPWMVQHVDKMPGRANFKWVSYVPIDRDILNVEWLPSLKAADVLVLYSRFGQEVVERQLPRVKTEMIYHGVDTDQFRPIDQAEARAASQVDPSTFVVGFVGRNQIRKRIPRLVNAFKAWNCKTYIEKHNVGKFEAEEFCADVQKWRCDKCEFFKQKREHFNSALYLHTTQGYTDQNDGLWVGWHLNEYADRYKLNENPFQKPSRVFVPDPRIMKTLQGVSDEALNTVYNTMNVHVLPTCREGFGLPILEAMACGIPSIVTKYSSVVELCADGRGLYAEPICFDDEPFWDAPSAIVDIKQLTDQIQKVPEMMATGEWDTMKQECRKYALKMQWKIVFRKWNRLFSELLA